MNRTEDGQKYVVLMRHSRSGRNNRKTLIGKQSCRPVLFIPKQNIFLLTQFHVLLRGFAVGDKGGQILQVAEGNDGFLTDFGGIHHAVNTVRTLHNSTHP